MPAPSLPPAPPTQLTSRPNFSDLPMEIQLMIWQFAVASDPAPALILRSYTLNQQTQMLSGRADIPPLLHVCYLSRLLASQRWTLVFPYGVTAILESEWKEKVRREWGGAVKFQGDCFPDLPIEIQAMIWQHAIHSVPGRDFIIRYSSIPQALQIGPAQMRWTEIISPTWTTIPALLHTCQLSRLLAQDRWTLDMPSDPEDGRMVFVDSKTNWVDYLG
ncbi:hypothetical protein VE01_09185 [Pseudogymnoascus verrucosus]|uniref:2EXR domain-containing protein n=1 Tax=Pseudogymnoascus verrucosus TaxID=342668 RepID=A0A1B8GBI9_9PEZI|nr:uncharacterized protein VE01_09185 [Pseudogymnoascus verrucosus]OBT93147.1 hypothetical protein VE01_09185 [Pseudogymnoascus verrucosus]